MSFYYDIPTCFGPLLGTLSGWRVESFKTGNLVHKNVYFFCEISQLKLFILLLLSSLSS